MMSTEANKESQVGNQLVTEPVLYHTKYSVGQAFTNMVAEEISGNEKNEATSKKSVIQNAGPNELERIKIAKDRAHRLAANREHAKASRKRKKTMIEDLQKHVAALTTENRILKDIHAKCQQELHMARSRSGLPSVDHAEYIPVPTEQWDNMRQRLAWYENQLQTLKTKQHTTLNSAAVEAAINLSSQASFGFDVANPSVANPSVANPTMANLSVANPTVANLSVANPTVVNLSVANPTVANHSVANPTFVNPTPNPIQSEPPEEKKGAPA